MTFANCRSLKTVVLPASVEVFCNRAFYNCSKLESITGIAEVKIREGENPYEGCLDSLIKPNTKYIK